jgi:hypothetical protein
MKRLALLMVLFTASTAPAAVSYRFAVNTTGAHAGTASGQVIADGPHIRVVFERGDQILFRDGSVALSNDGGKSVIVLDPASKTFVALKVDAMLGDAASLLTFTTPKISSRDLGDGGVVAGLPTRRFSFDASYDVVLDLGAQKVRTHVTMHSDSRRTARIPEESASLLQLRGFRSGVPALDKVIAASAAPKGFPLEETTTVRMKGEGGSETTIRSTTEVREVKTVTAGRGLFEIPAGYRRKR